MILNHFGAPFIKIIAVKRYTITNADASTGDVFKPYLLALHISPPSVVIMRPPSVMNASRDARKQEKTLIFHNLSPSMAWQHRKHHDIWPTITDLAEQDVVLLKTVAVKKIEVLYDCMISQVRETIHGIFNVSLRFVVITLLAPWLWLWYEGALVKPYWAYVTIQLVRRLPRVLCFTNIFGLYLNPIL